MNKVNYHTHTYRCKHASGTDEEYVKAAIEGGLKVLGFADHAPWQYKTKYVSRMRMSYQEMAEYVESVRSLKEKYKDKIDILLGLECEYYPEYMDYLKKLIKDYKLDYIIFGNHYDLTDETGRYFGRITDEDKYMDTYLERYIQGLDTGLYSYLCHPDLFMRARKVFDAKAKDISHRLCSYAKEKDIILEFNLEGMHNTDSGYNVYYPCLEFWKIVSEYQNRVIIGFDAHSPQSLKTNRYYDKALATLKDLNLNIEENIKCDLWQNLN